MRMVWIGGLILGVGLALQSGAREPDLAESRGGSSVLIALPESAQEKAVGFVQFLEPTGEMAEAYASILRNRIDRAVEQWKTAPFEMENLVEGSSEEGSFLVFRNSEGVDLGELLVGEGLVEVSGETKADGDAARYRDNLLGLEREARFKGRGIWASPRMRRAAVASAKPAALDGLPEHSATDENAVAEHIGKLVVIQGTIDRIGATQSGHITFLNFQGVERGGLVVIVREENLPGLRDAIAGFPDSMQGKQVRVTGRLSEFRGTPQIEIRDAGQLETSE